MSIAAADFNADGVTDLVTLDSMSGTLSLLLGKGDGTFGPASSVDAGALGYQAFALGDFNGDGQVDVATDGYTPTGMGMRVLFGNGNGTFRAPVISASVGSALTTGDFNRDGKLDVAAPGRVALGNGDGTFQAPITVATEAEPLTLVTTGDFDGDGKLDLAFGQWHGIAYAWILLGHGDGTFAAPVGYPLVWAFETDFLATDLNGDGHADLAFSIGNGAGAVGAMLGGGNGTFPAPAYTDAGPQYWGLATADFDRDGKADLATPTADADAGVTVFLGNGDGTFQAPQRYAAGSGPASASQSNTIVTGDFNGDGIADLAIANSATNDVSVLLGTGCVP